MVSVPISKATTTALPFNRQQHVKLKNQTYHVPPKKKESEKANRSNQSSKGCVISLPGAGPRPWRSAKSICHRAGALYCSRPAVPPTKGAFLPDTTQHAGPQLSGRPLEAHLCLLLWSMLLFLSLTLTLSRSMLFKLKKSPCFVCFMCVFFCVCVVVGEVGYITTSTSDVFQMSNHESKNLDGFQSARLSCQACVCVCACVWPWEVWGIWATVVTSQSSPILWGR